MATPSLFVIDDFHPDPKRLRAQALAAVYAAHGGTLNVGYRCRVANADRTDTARCVAKMLPVLRCFGTARLAKSQFVAETYRDETLTKARMWVHADPWRWAALLYLNPPAQCRGGTSFFRHRRTGLTRWKPKVSNDAWHEHEVGRDSSDLSKWEVTHNITMVFNRLVIFDPLQFHQATCYFGRNLRDARLFQQFVFDGSRRL